MRKQKYSYQSLDTNTSINENGTVRMLIENVEDTVNIRRLTPYFVLTTFLMGECAVCGLLGSGKDIQIPIES